MVEHAQAWLLKINRPYVNKNTNLSMNQLIIVIFYLKYLTVKAGQLRQARRSGGTLTQTIKLTGHAFKYVQWDHVSNMKITRNISPLSLAYPNFCVGFWAGSKHGRIPKNLSPPYVLTGIATLLIGPVSQSQPMKTS